MRPSSISLMSSVGRKRCSIRRRGAARMAGRVPSGARLVRRSRVQRSVARVRPGPAGPPDGALQAIDTHQVAWSIDLAG